MVLEKVLQVHWKGLGRKEIRPENMLEGLKLKLQSLTTWCEELTHWKRPWCWERLKAGGEGDDRGWDGWIASLSWWTWVWVNSGSWWWTGRPGVLQSMGSQRVRHHWATELNWIFYSFLNLIFKVDLSKFYTVSIGYFERERDIYIIYFYLEYSCFTMLCWFLLYSNMNQLQVYIDSLPP